MTDHIGKNIKYYRKQKGYTQEKLAELVGFSISSLKSLESGNSLTSLGNFMRICRVLDVPSDFILSDSGHESRIACIAQMMEWLMKLENEHFEHLANTIELIYYFKSHMEDPPFVFQKTSKTSDTEISEDRIQEHDPETYD